VCQALELLLHAPKTLNMDEYVVLDAAKTSSASALPVLLLLLPRTVFAR
jgi:hypothetical protein